ncbi:MAG: hypothetical protein EOO86_15865 [Pedobacter sp.]|nr:MAG: hypothetical protein EOO86_15865 [Pedobacter sp.]
MLVLFNQSEPDESVMTSLMSSFNRNSGFKLSDISLSIGAEYVHKKTIAFRAGYNLQGDERLPGNFFSTGLGVKVKK